MHKTLGLVVLVAACERAAVAPPERVATTKVDPLATDAGVAISLTPKQPQWIHPRERIDPVVVKKKTWFMSLTAVQRHDVREFCELKVADPCEGMTKPDGAKLDPGVMRMTALIDRFADDDQDRVRRFCARNYAAYCMTPLVVAFEPGAIALRASTATFAFDRTPVVTDWPTASTPWLALDRDGDGAITNGGELFGDATRLADRTRAAHGFAALAELDTNRDGVIDARDPMFASLLLWADANGDHASTADELSFASTRLTSIALAYDSAARCDDRGNCEGQRARMSWRDASGVRDGEVVDIYLRRR